MRRAFSPLVDVFPCCVWVGLQAAWSQTKGPARALPPRWNEDIKSVFPGRCLQELKGKPGQTLRPASPAAGTTNVASSSGNGGTPAPAAGGSVAWSKIIEPDYLLAEISHTRTGAEDVKSLSGFKCGGYKNSRISYSIARTDVRDYRRIRWRMSVSKKMRSEPASYLGEFSMNLKVSTDQAFNESKARAEDLAALIRGDTIQSPRTLIQGEVARKGRQSPAADDTAQHRNRRTAKQSDVDAEPLPRAATWSCTKPK